jgi:hypothetical protein
MIIGFEQIKKANESIKTTDIKGKDYAEVNQRIKAFRMCYPNGSITTEIVSLADGIVTIKATVANGEGEILATGYAQEKESSSYINKTSYIENCETSAVGRALGFCGFGIDTSVASYEEEANAIANQENPAEAKKTASQGEGLDKALLAEAERLKIELPKVAAYLKKPVENLTNEDLQRCIDQKTKALGGAKND